MSMVGSDFRCVEKHERSSRGSRVELVGQVLDRDCYVFEKDRSRIYPGRSGILWSKKQCTNTKYFCSLIEKFLFETKRLTPSSVTSAPSPRDYMGRIADRARGYRGLLGVEIPKKLG